MSQDIKDTLSTAFLMKDIKGKQAAEENEYFADNADLMKAEISRIKEASALEEGMCEKLDAILPKL
jgi:hypothetical protein